jgi:hexosaminidase
LSLTGTTGTEPIAADQAVAVEANTISGGLSCSTNNPAPVNGGHSNKASGNKSGQCAKL